MNPEVVQLRNRVMAVAMVLVAVAGIGLATLLAWHQRDAFLAGQGALLTDSVHLSGARIRQAIRGLRENTLFLAHTPPVQGIVRASGNSGFDARDGNTIGTWQRRLQEIFAAFIQAHPDYFAIRYIGLADGGRELVLSERIDTRVESAAPERLAQMADQAFFRQASQLQPGAVYLSEVGGLESEAPRNLLPARVLRAATPVFGADGRLFGVLSVSFDASQLLQGLNQGLPTFVRLALADMEGRYLLPPDPERQPGRAGAAEARLEQDFPGLLGMTPPAASLMPIRAGGETQHVALERIFFDPDRPERHLILLCTLAESEVYRQIGPAIQDAAIAAGGTALLSVALILAVLARLFAPLHRMTAVAAAIAEGNYATPVPAARSGGIGALAQALARMQARVQEREIDFIALNEELERRVRARTAELRLAERVILNTIEGVIVTDAGGRIVSVNPAFSDITGYAAEEVIGRNPNLLSSHRHPPEFFCTMWEDLSRNGFWRGEVWNRRKSGELFLENLTISRIPGDDDFPTHFVGVFQDITELRSKDARIRHLAYHDPLTGLANRMLLQDRLKHALSLAQRNRRMVGLMFIDLDRFKSINDSLGHDVGDSLLQEVASRISRCVRISDTVARPGGDEFLVITDEIPRADACAVVAQKIIAALSQPMEICGHAIQIGCSVGIAVYPEDAATSVDLMKHADAAMYAAKGAGGGVFRYFQAEMTERNLQRLTLEMDLRRAISNGEMELHYQPKLDLRTHALVGLEALVRWRCPDRGLVLPGEFIPVAEETGVIIELGDWVLEEACRQIAGWQAQGILPAPVAVNVSSRQFQKVNLADRVREATDRHRIDPALLELELTESTVMTNILQTIEVFQALRGIGVSIAVDDFGTGYSSLTYLRRLPVNVIKIDRSFVVGLGSSDEDAEIIRTIIALARALGLTVVAEGVETTGQAEVLRTLECDLAQGFLFSRALPAHQITGWLRGRGPAPPAGSAA